MQGVLGVMGQINQDCTPAPPCDTSTVLNMYRDPENCSTYYMCMPHHEFDYFSCLEGQMFDGNDCVSYETSGCIICNEANEPRCRYTCPSELPDPSKVEFLADAYDCRVFHICNDGNIFDSIMCEEQNPDKPFFDGNVCQADESMCCDPCTLYCWEENSTISDPFDCRSYYMCNGVGEAPYGPSYCSENTVFDPQLGTCNADTPCKPPCTESPVDTTTTTAITTTTSSSLIPESCQDSFICEEVGVFPMCTGFCSKYYFHCDYFSIGGEAAVLTCRYPQVLDPIQVVCVDPLKCPLSSIASRDDEH